MGATYGTMDARIRGAVLGKLGAELCAACEKDIEGEALPARLSDLIERLRQREYVQSQGSGRSSL
jgi:hypothetical protein